MSDHPGYLEGPSFTKQEDADKLLVAGCLYEVKKPHHKENARDLCDNAMIIPKCALFTVTSTIVPVEK